MRDPFTSNSAKMACAGVAQLQTLWRCCANWAGSPISDFALISMAPLKLPSGEVVSLIQLRFQSEGGKKIYVVSLPSAIRFTARTLSGNDEFDVARLSGAVVQASGQVRLSDGTNVSAVEVLPVRLPLEPSTLDWKIVWHTIALLKAEDLCTFPLRERYPVEVRNAIPDVRVIDFSKLATLQVPGLKTIAHYITIHEPEISVSNQKIADALANFGMRRPIRQQKKLR